MSATDYLAGAQTAAPCVPLTGDPAATPWDPGLRETIHETGRAVYEETVTDHLLADLADDIKPAGTP
ncbi:MAG: DUF2399 domain-containing protein [Streptosporangiaceae bacterium]|jgi:hypothetical protein